MSICQFWALIHPFAEIKLFLKKRHFHVPIGPFDCAKFLKIFRADRVTKTNHFQDQIGPRNCFGICWSTLMNLLTY